MRILMIFLTCIIFSCRSTNEIDLHYKFTKYVDDNYTDYSPIFDKVNIWLENARNARQENVRSIVFDSNYKLDKLLLINAEGNKLVGTVNLSDSINKNTTHDWIFMILGIKISGKWNFIRGGSLYVPRENYKYNINEPLNHSQLSYIGRDFFLKRFLTFNEDNIKVNSDAINNKVIMAEKYKFTSIDPVKNWEDYIEDQNNKIISDKEFNDIRASLDNKVHVDQVLPKRGTKAWKELYGNKIPLFEREDWKNIGIK